jgi:hypothetical protein
MLSCNFNFINGNSKKNANFSHTVIRQKQECHMLILSLKYDMKKIMVVSEW